MVEVLEGTAEFETKFGNFPFQMFLLCSCLSVILVDALNAVWCVEKIERVVQTVPSIRLWLIDVNCDSLLRLMQMETGNVYSSAFESVLDVCKSTPILIDKSFEIEIKSEWNRVILNEILKNWNLMCIQKLKIEAHKPIGSRFRWCVHS